jgi:hypothetical protein
MNHVAIIRLDSSAMRLPVEFGSMPHRSPPSVKIEQIGGDIVNSISIHKLEGNSELGIADDIVAVFTNNDKTVRIFSLMGHEQTATLDLPFAVNHATISPDGRMLVAVGDYQQAYIYERIDVKPSPDLKSQKLVASHCEWEMFNIVSLHVPKPAVVAGYFTTAWSPNGRLCSLSSELGYVTMLDIEALKTFDDGEDATVAVVPSTRPDTRHGPGGIRSTQFTPHPWDLFISAEDQDRVCIADLRTGMCIRQVLHLDPNQEGCEHIKIADHPASPYSRGLDPVLEAEFIRQFRRSHADDDPDSADTYLTDNRRLARLASRLAQDEEHYPMLMSQERQVLDALGAGRHREDSLSYSPAPRSIYYRGEHSELALESRRSTTARQSSLFSQDFPGLARSSDSGTSTGGTTLALPIPTTATEYLRTRNLPDPERTSFYTPRRQQSILVGNDDSDPGSSHSATAATSRHPPLPPHLRASAATFADWTREASLLARRPSPPPAGEAQNPELAERRRRAIYRARERALTQREAERSERLTQRMSSDPNSYDRSYGLRTAGLAVSGDGRKIWAACDEGIFEYDVNVKGRMILPAVEMR